MTLRSFLLACSAVLLTSQVSAQSASSGSGVYTGIVGGVPFFDGGENFIDYDPGYLIGGQVGYRIGSFRTEAEIAYQSTELRDGGNDVFGFDVIQGTLSAYYDIPVVPELSGLSPYVGGGIGGANITVEGENGNSAEDDETGLMLHGEFGFGIAVSQSFELVPHYRFEWFDTGVAGLDEDLYDHAFRLSARLGF